MTAALFITFAITAIMGFPIWIVLVLSCFAGIFLGGSATPMLVIAQRMFTSVDSFPLLAIPLFMVAGNLMEGGGISPAPDQFLQLPAGRLHRWPGHGSRADLYAVRSHLRLRSRHCGSHRWYHDS